MKLQISKAFFIRFKESNQGFIIVHNIMSEHESNTAAVMLVFKRKGHNNFKEEKRFHFTPGNCVDHNFCRKVKKVKRYKINISK